MVNNFTSRPKCLICGENDSFSLYKASFGKGETWEFLRTYYKGRLEQEKVNGGTYDLKKCKKCGFIWQSQILSQELMATLYEKWISPEESFDKEHNRTRTYNSMLFNEVNFIAFILNAKQTYNFKVLDFGMGWGRWCLMCNAFGFYTRGFDLSRKRIEYAKKTGVEVVNGFEDLEYEFDYINMEQVLEHIPAPLGTLMELVSHLRAGGLVRISVPNGKRFERQYRRRKWVPQKDAVHPLEHINCFQHETLNATAEQCGLAPIKPWRYLSATIRQALQGSTSLKFLAESLLKQMFGTSIIYYKKS